MRGRLLLDDAPPRFGPTAALVALAVVLHLGLYAPSLQNAYTFDDRKVVLENLIEHGPVSFGSLFAAPYFARQENEGTAYRPLALSSLALDARLFGPSVTAMRLENVVWAGLGAGLLAIIAASVSGSLVTGALTALLVSVHPVRSEAIVSIVGRSELMAFALTCAALLCAIRCWRRHSWTWSAPSALFLLAALLSKETAFAAAGPLLALLLVDRERVRWRTLRALGLAWTAAYLIAFGVRARVLGGPLKSPQSRITASENQLAVLPPGERVTGALALVPLAAERLVWPATLVGDYGTRTFSGGELRSKPRIAAGAALLVVVLACGLALAWARHASGVGLLWALSLYVPFGNLVFVTGFAFTERVLYAPAAGIGLSVACGLIALAARGRRSLVAVGALVLAIAWAGAWRLGRRLPEWQDDETLFRSVVRDRPSNGRAWLNLAVIDLSRRDAARAESDLTAALRADASLEPNARWMEDHARSIGQPRLEEAVRRAIDAALRR